MERVLLPSKTTCTELILQLNNILKYNTTLEEISICSGLFLSTFDGEYGHYRQWTGLGPLQQFNVGAVGNSMSPNLRRSFSSSDLTQPQSLLFWDKHFPLNVNVIPFETPKPPEIHFTMIFLMKQMEGKKLVPLPSFTAPDTEVLQSFSGLDPRLRKCLGISGWPHIVNLRNSCWNTLNKVNDTYGHWRLKALETF